MINWNTTYGGTEFVPLNSIIANDSYRPVYSDKTDIHQLILIWLDNNARSYSPDSIKTMLLLRQISNNQCLFSRSL